jgi:D-beta-D-heptose 7-phosphate kinase / D-beta-D-heptose 1-phosphate adenosyltransferase
VDLSSDSFRQARVLVVGDVMLDRYWSGSTSRISPEAPVPVVHVQRQEERAGGAGNVAMNIVALRGTAELAGLIGQDADGDLLRQRLEAAGIQQCLEAIPGAHTITKLRVLSRHQQLLRLDFEAGFSVQQASQLAVAVVPRMTAAGAVVLSDYGKGTLAQVQELIQAARQRGLPVLVDPKGADFTRYRGATLLTPNVPEFEAVAGPCADEATLVAKGEAIRQELALEYLLITRGEHGMTLLGRPEGPLHLPAKAREVFDVTGAGDTVIGVLAAALAVGFTVTQACIMANTAAGLVVGKLGAATVDPVELLRALHDDQTLTRGAITEDDLLGQLRAARARGERMVFTNGCFDILHAGHVRYLQEARLLGDRLIVAINSDASVRRLKGATRPINPLEHRMTVLAGLASVDWVIPFTEDTPERLLTVLKPEVLVKGGDYTADQVVGAELMRSWGGEVAVLSLTQEVSTTRIAALIQAQDAQSS